MVGVIGVIGVGTISSACVRGICGGTALKPKFVLSPRNADKAQALADEYPESVTVLDSNQAVIDAADAVIISVLPALADAVLEPLTFRAGQLIISLMAAVSLARVEALIAPASNCCVAMPLPAVARRVGITLVVPAVPYALEFFDALGSAVGVADEAQFRRLQCMTCVMGDIYERERTMLQWLVEHDVDAEAAASYVGKLVHSITSDAALEPTPTTLAHLVAEQTPGGMNEMVIREQREDGAYASLQHSLDSVHSRLAGAHDPELVPAKKRARQSP